MTFFIELFLCNLIIPLIALISGLWMYKKPPKKINGFIGYRTKMSRKNKDTWAFAHNCCGKLWIKLGIAMLIICIAVQLPFAHSGEDVLTVLTLVLEMLQLAALVCSAIPVEKALKNTFDEHGFRRNPSEDK